MSEDTNWVEAMAQQTRAEIQAEALKLQNAGMPAELAKATARKRAGIGLQIRSKLLTAVVEVTTREGYSEKSIKDKVKSLRAALSDGTKELREEMISPVERIIESNRDLVEHELISRIEAESKDSEPGDSNGTSGGTDPAP
jgi:hypothetical protein